MATESKQAPTWLLTWPAGVWRRRQARGGGAGREWEEEELSVEDSAGPPTPRRPCARAQNFFCSSFSFNSRVSHTNQCCYTTGSWRASSSGPAWAATYMFSCYAFQQDYITPRSCPKINVELARRATWKTNVYLSVYEQANSGCFGSLESGIVEQKHKQTRKHRLGRL